MSSLDLDSGFGPDAEYSSGYLDVEGENEVPIWGLKVLGSRLGYCVARALGVAEKDVVAWTAHAGSNYWKVDMDDKFGLLSLSPQMIAMALQVANGLRLGRSKGARKVSLNTRLGLTVVHAAHLHVGIPVLEADVIQLVEEGRIPYYTA